MSEWISIKKKLPTPHNWILYAVLTDEPNIYRTQIAYYSTSLKWMMECNKRRSIKVTHWTPLPEYAYE